MKNFLRKWLGINADVAAISHDITLLHNDNQMQASQMFGIFQALPWISNVRFLNAQDAASITTPSMIEPNALDVLLLGVTINARLGQSSFEVQGVVNDSVRATLIARGFKVEEHEGTGGKSTFILWT
jgi:hypothetical protein